MASPEGYEDVKFAKHGHEVCTLLCEMLKTLESIDRKSITYNPEMKDFRIYTSCSVPQMLLNRFEWNLRDSGYTAHWVLDYKPTPSKANLRARVAFGVG